MTSRMVEVFKAVHEQQAHLLAKLLQDEGIEAVVLNGESQIAFAGFPWAYPSVRVPEEQVGKAMPLVARFDENSRGNLPPDRWGRLPEETEEYVTPNLQADENEDVIDVIHWPRCPECNTPRPTECPYCHLRGIEFQAAYGTAHDDEPQLLCPSCDEPFVPQFFRSCHVCSSDFGDGKEIRSVGSQLQIDLNPRVLIVFAVTAGMIAGILGLFYWLLSI